ncbi:hypothetical protein [Nocardia sp. alder85J]|nr:hypothetical protein [Nocardia sp. alder85J]MCX4094548.1 hypothetical protein [Nocardia sp. alder85J]
MIPAEIPLTALSVAALVAAVLLAWLLRDANATSIPATNAAPPQPIRTS